MKKAITLIILIILIPSLITGCSGKSRTEKPDLSFLPTESQRPVVIIDDESYGLSMIVYSTKNYDQADSWSSFLKSRFGIDIKLGYFSLASVEEGVKLDAIGLVYIPNENFFDIMVNAGLLESLTEYIPYTSISNRYRSEILGRYKINNDIYAIPEEWRMFWQTRYYKKAWLGDYNPKDIDSTEKFYEFAKYVSAGDPDKNGINDTPVIRTSISFIDEEIPDIQKAFGCYFSRFGSHLNYSSSISYNLMTASYEDAGFSENITDYLYFIKNLKDEGLMTIEEYYPNRMYVHDEDSGVKLASFWNYGDNLNLAEEYETGSAVLSGINAQYLNSVFLNPGCYGILKGTENIQGHLELFYDEIAENRDFVLGLRFGNPDSGVYSIYEDFYVKYDQNAEVPGFNVPNDFVMFYSGREPDPSMFLGVIKKKNEEAREYARNQQMSMDMTNMYILPWNNSDSYLLGNLHSTGSVIAFNNIVLDLVFNGNTGIEDAVAEYRKQILKSGIITKLSDVNEKIGSLLSYNYN